MAIRIQRKLPRRGRKYAIWEPFFITPKIFPHLGYMMELKYDFHKPPRLDSDWFKQERTITFTETREYPQRFGGKQFGSNRPKWWKHRVGLI